MAPRLKATATPPPGSKKKKLTRTPGKITKTKLVDEIVLSKEMKEECPDEIKVKTEPNLLENDTRSTIRKETVDGKVSWIQTCPYCTKETQDLVTHIKINHKGMEWKGIRTQCPICDKLPVDIKNHIRQVHEKVRNFACDQCPLKFINQARLKSHVDGVHKNLKTECPHCGVTLKVNCLKMHIANLHGAGKPRIPCSFEGCDKSYTAKADMERHLLRIHHGYKIKCEFCDLMFSPDQMGRHVKVVHHGIHKFYCKICSEGFATEGVLKNHTNKVHGGTFFKCQLPKLEAEGVCKKKFWSDGGLYDHARSHLEKSSLVYCKKCRFDVHQCFWDHHVKTVHENTKVKCTLEGCEEEFPGHVDLQDHFRAEHPSLMEGRDWCHLCRIPTAVIQWHNKQFHETDDMDGTAFRPLYSVHFSQICRVDGCKFFATNIRYLDEHTRSVHGIEPRTKCSKCGRIVRDMEKHNRDFHSLLPVHACDHCDKKFASIDKLKTHMSTHTQGLKTCEICHAEVRKLEQHMRGVHTGEGKLTCEVEGCKTTFMSKLALKKHMLHVHEGVKYECEICGKEVVNLRMHVKLVHEQIRNYKCPECSKSFQTLTHLRTHVARVHLNAREKCPDCGKMVQDLYSHVRFVHQQTKNFPCDQCDRRCATSYELKNHIRSVHLGKKVTCPDCGMKVTKDALTKHRKKCFSSSEFAKYQCHVCQDRFILKENLERHLSNKHEIKPLLVAKHEEVKDEDVKA